MSAAQPAAPGDERETPLAAAGAGAGGPPPPPGPSSKKKKKNKKKKNKGSVSVLPSEGLAGGADDDDEDSASGTATPATPAVEAPIDFSAPREGEEQPNFGDHVTGHAFQPMMGVPAPMPSQGAALFSDDAEGMAFEISSDPLDNVFDTPDYTTALSPAEKAAVPTEDKETAATLPAGIATWVPNNMEEGAFESQTGLDNAIEEAGREHAREAEAVRSAPPEAVPSQPLSLQRAPAEEEASPAAAPESSAPSTTVPTSASASQESRETVVEAAPSAPFLSPPATAAEPKATEAKEASEPEPESAQPDFNEPPSALFADDVQSIAFDIPTGMDVAEGRSDPFAPGAVDEDVPAPEVPKPIPTAVAAMFAGDDEIAAFDVGDQDPALDAGTGQPERLEQFIAEPANMDSAKVASMFANDDKDATFNFEDPVRGQAGVVAPDAQTVEELSKPIPANIASMFADDAEIAAFDVGESAPEADQTEAEIEHAPVPAPKKSEPAAANFASMFADDDEVAAFDIGDSAPEEAGLTALDAENEPEPPKPIPASVASMFADDDEIAAFDVGVTDAPVESDVQTDQRHGNSDVASRSAGPHSLFDDDAGVDIPISTEEEPKASGKPSHAAALFSDEGDGSFDFGASEHEPSGETRTAPAPGASSDRDMSAKGQNDTSIRSMFSDDWLVDTSADNSFDLLRDDMPAEEHHSGDVDLSADVDDSQVPQGWYDETGEWNWYTEEQRELVKQSMIADGSFVECNKSQEPASENAARRTPEPSAADSYAPPADISYTSQSDPYAPQSSYAPSAYTSQQPSTSYGVSAYGQSAPSAAPYGQPASAPSGYGQPAQHSGGLYTPGFPQTSSFGAAAVPHGSLLTPAAPSVYDPYAPTSSVSGFSSVPPAAPPSQAPASKPKQPEPPVRMKSTAYDPPFLRPSKSFVRPAASPALDSFVAPIAPAVITAPVTATPPVPPAGPPRRQTLDRVKTPSNEAVAPLTVPHEQPGSRSVSHSYSEYAASSPPSKASDPYAPEASAPLQRLDPYAPPPFERAISPPAMKPPARPASSAAPPKPTSFDPPLRQTSSRPPSRHASRPNFAGPPSADTPPVPTVPAAFASVKTPASEAPPALAPPPRGPSRGPSRGTTPMFEEPPVRTRTPPAAHPPPHAASLQKPSSPGVPYRTSSPATAPPRVTSPLRNEIKPFQPRQREAVSLHDEQVFDPEGGAGEVWEEDSADISHLPPTHSTPKNSPPRSQKVVALPAQAVFHAERPTETDSYFPHNAQEGDVEGEHPFAAHARRRSATIKHVPVPPAQQPQTPPRSPEKKVAVLSDPYAPRSPEKARPEPMPQQSPKKNYNRLSSDSYGRSAQREGDATTSGQIAPSSPKKSRSSADGYNAYAPSSPKPAADPYEAYAPKAEQKEYNPYGSISPKKATEPYNPYEASTEQEPHDPYGPGSSQTAQPPKPVQAEDPYNPYAPSTTRQPPADPYNPYGTPATSGHNQYSHGSSDYSRGHAKQPSAGLNVYGQSTSPQQTYSPYVPVGTSPELRQDAYSPYAPTVPLASAGFDEYGARTISPPVPNFFQSMGATGPADPTYVPQQVLEQRPVSEDPLGRCAPAARNVPLAVFGFGGYLITSFPGEAEDSPEAPAYGYGSHRGLIHIRPVSDVAESSALSTNSITFPGPLIFDSATPKGAAGDKKRKENVLSYLSQRADEIERGLPYLKTSANRKRREEEAKLVILRILTAFIEGDGKLFGTPKAEEAIRAALQPPAAAAAAGMSNGLGAPAAGGARATPAQLAQLNSIVLSGDKAEAVQFATSAGLWAHAVVLASAVGPDLWRETVARWVAAELKDPKMAGLKTAYSVIGGLTTSTIDDLYTTANITNDPSADQWREVIGGVLFYGKATDLTNLDALGSKFGRAGLLNAAQVCYLLSPNSPFSDMSSSAADRPVRLVQEARDDDGAIFAEVAEYARSLVPTPKGAEVPHAALPQLLPYKLRAAWRAAELGDVEQAKRYCDAIDASAKAGKHPHIRLPRHLVASMEDLLERLTGTPSTSTGLGVRKSKSGASLGSWIEGRLTKFIAGEEDSAPAKPAPVEDKTGAPIGPFSHFSTISPGASTAVSRAPSMTNISDDMHVFSPAQDEAGGGYQPWGDDEEEDNGPTPHAVPTVSLDDGEFINPMGNLSFGAPTPVASTDDYKPKPRLVEDDDEDMGFGNSSLSRGRTPKVPEDDDEPKGKGKAKEDKKPAAAKAEIAPAAGAKSEQKGWFRGWFGKKEGEGGPIRANLGEESSMVYDPDLKRWVVKGAKGEKIIPSAPAPPPRAKTASPAQHGRDVPHRPATGTPPVPPLPAGISRPSGAASQPSSRQPSASGPPPGAPPSSAPPSGPPGTNTPPVGGARPPVKPASAAPSIDDLLSRPSSGRPTSAAAKKKRAHNKYVDVFQQ